MIKIKYKQYKKEVLNKSEEEICKNWADAICKAIDEGVLESVINDAKKME